MDCCCLSLLPSKTKMLHSQVKQKKSKRETEQVAKMHCTESNKAPERCVGSGVPSVVGFDLCFFQVRTLWSIPTSLVPADPSLCMGLGQVQTLPLQHSDGRQLERPKFSSFAPWAANDLESKERTEKWRDIGEN